ncbi:MAG: VCBS repeat-containing protein, partial [Acidobacteria bacterium]|nr:VCBS repeat-containing protein [Acidobacteriota bacterium]
RQDIFLINGSRLEGFPKGQEPRNHLYRNVGGGKFQDVTREANLARSGWGNGVCVGDFDNDGYDDLYVTYWGRNTLYLRLRRENPLILEAVQGRPFPAAPRETGPDRKR